MRIACVLLGLALCAASASPARAQDDKAASLGHDTVLRLAAERNLGLLVRGLERERAASVADAARRPYLPEAGLETAIKETVGESRRAIEWIPSLSYTSQIGTSVTAEARFTEGISGNRENQRALTIELSQALLRRGFTSSAATGLRQADIDVQIEKERFRAELNQLLVRTDRAYWELAFARGDLEIKKRSRDRARAQFEETKENIRRGLLAPGEIFIVEQSLVDFEERLNRAEENLALSESALRRILYLPPTYPVRATFEGDPKAAADVAEADSLDVSATRNPDVLAAKLSADRARVGIGGDESDALPQLDVFGSLGARSGVDSSSNAVPEGPDLRAGVRLSVPLYWGPDVARVRRARTERVQRHLELREAEGDASAAVRDAATRLRARRQRVDLAARIVGLAQSKLDVEREKYKSGLSTLADVVSFQRELDAALGGELRARVDLLTARAEMFAARGDLDEHSKVHVK